MPIYLVIIGAIIISDSYTGWVFRLPPQESLRLPMLVVGTIIILVGAALWIFEQWADSIKDRLLELRLAKAQWDAECRVAKGLRAADDDLVSLTKSASVPRT
jgi:hypothetical protein